MPPSEIGIDAERSIGELDRYTRVVLRMARRNSGVSLDAAAAAAGCSASTLRRIEMGKAPLYFDQLLRLAAVYHLSLDELEARARHIAASAWLRAVTRTAR